MATADIKEIATEVREERATSLKSFFDNIFVQPQNTDEKIPAHDESIIDIKNNIDIENDTYTELAIDIENETHIENDTDIDKEIYVQNNINTEGAIYSEKVICIEDSTYIESNTDIENSTHTENNTYVGNATYSLNDINAGNTTYINNNTPEKTIYTENKTIEKDTYINNTTPASETYRENDYRKSETYIEKSERATNTYTNNAPRENNIYIDNKSPENNMYIQNAIYKSKTVRLAEFLGFTALGTLAVLIDEFPSASGMLNVTQLSKACGVARTTLIAQLRSLEKAGVIQLGQAEKQGRYLKILCMGNTTHIENDIPVSSSSALNKNNYYLQDVPFSTDEKKTIEIDTDGVNNTYIENDIHINNGMYIENDISTNNDIYPEKHIHSENAAYDKNNIYIDKSTHIRNDTYSKNNIVSEKLSRSPITIAIAARELFFSAKASLINVDKLTNQCFQQFLNTKQTKGSKYAMALFYNLFSKSKDNPNAYVIKAIQQGATASLEDEQTASVIAEAGDSIFKEIGVDILQKDLEAALTKLSLTGQTQGQIRDELDSFTKRISN